MKLFDALRSKPNGDELSDRLLREVRVHSLRKLEHTKDLFPEYTDHTIRHSDGVIQILDQFMPDDLKDQLNEWELYFLIAAAYTHDLGMVEGCPGRPADEEWTEFLHKFQRANLDEAKAPAELEREALRLYVRDTHHLRSEVYVRSHGMELGLRATDTIAEATNVAVIGSGHRKRDLSDSSVFGLSSFGHNQFIRRDILAAYLRLADELDTTAFRTPLAEFESLDIRDSVSTLEWSKHLSVHGVRNDNGVLVLDGECHDHAVFLRLRKLQNDLRAKLIEMKSMLPRPYSTSDGFSVKDPLPYHDVKLNVTTVGFLPIEIQFDLQDDEIIKLIMGERLYGDRTACVRELVQNAVDTCREALELRPPTYSPEIHISVSDQGRTWTFEDNGMGMDEYRVRQYFSRVGISYYRSSEFHGVFRPTSQFGIGFLSCFMVADRIEVQSKREGADAIDLEISHLTEPFVPRKGKRRSPGTTVTLRLKEDLWGNEVDLRERVLHFAPFVSIPVYYRGVEGDWEELTRRSLLPTPEQLRSALEIEQRTYFRGDLTDQIVAGASSYIEDDGIEVLVVLLPYLFPSGLLPQSYYYERNRNREITCRLYQDGYYVRRLNEDIFGRFVWCNVNVTGTKRFELTADRSRVSSDNPDLSNEIRLLYSKAVESALARIRKQRPRVSWHSNNHLSYGSSWTKPEIPKHYILESAAALASWCVFTSTGFQTLTTNELRQYSSPIALFPERDHEYLHVLQEHLPPDWAVLVWPKPTGIEAVDLGLSQLRSPHDLFEAMGATVIEADIARQSRRFVDLGFSTGRWYLGWEWLLDEFGYGRYGFEKTDYGIGVGPLFDRRHPLSEFLFSWCVGNLPERSSLTLRTLFQNPRIKHSRRRTVIRELVRALHADGVMEQPVEIEDHAPVTREHRSCPYGLRFATSWDSAS